MLMFTSTHLVVAAGLSSALEVAGNRPFVTVTEGKSGDHRVTMTLKDVDAIDGLIAALSKGRQMLAPTARGSDAA